MRAVAFQIGSGLGAGNIGDELMNRAFWARIPPHWTLEVALFPEFTRQREPYPARHRYLVIDSYWPEYLHCSTPALLVGATPVTEAEGCHFPLEFLAPRLAHFHTRGLPVYVAGAGVEPLHSPRARELFAEYFLPIRSWSVRSPACRDALIALGVAADRIVVGADWAWLYQPRRDLRDWASGVWRDLGRDPSRPLLIANLVRGGSPEATARQFDLLASRPGYQIAFFSNESRPDYDHAFALAVRALMNQPALLVPNHYYSPDEALALLAFASVAVSQRYHFTVQSALAGVPALCLARSPKLASLAAELGLPLLTRSGDLARTLAVLDLATLRASLAARRAELTCRAAGNLDLVPSTLPGRS